MKYLPCPSFKFNQEFVSLLESTEGDKRVLVYPVANGLRARTLSSSHQVVIEISGIYARIEFVENVATDALFVPYMQNKTMASTDVLAIVECVHGFFEGTWEIEKDA